MGDFNMSLFKVVPELRSRGWPAQLVSWYPWRTTQTNQPMADSCGIFSLVDAVVTPEFSANIFDEGWWELDDVEENGGPGQSLATFLPKAQDLIEKVRDSFPAAVAATEKGQGKGNPPAVAEPEKGKGKGKGKNTRTGLTIREKRLDIDVWKFQGKNHKGSHFPLAAFTNNVGRRSEERYIARSNRGWKG